MLTGNGRHRRPRQAPALIVAAGVAGSAIAIPLLGATSASAASTATWDKLAECESGGSWSADPGNGYYGGLQFSQETWENYGGLDFAPRADQASRSQQIAVAEKVLDDQGPRAWPVCSVTSGLTADDAAADVDPGAALPTPSASAGDSGGDDAAKGDTAKDDASDEPADSASSGAKGDSREKNHDKSGDTAGNTVDDVKSDKSGQDDSTSTSGTPSSEASDDEGSATAPASGRHRGDAAEDDAAGSSRADDSSGRHASRGGESGRKGANTDEGAYTVRAGDNLWDIADTHDVDGGWAALYAENKKTVGTDPDLILPGQSLDLGLESGEK
ncbi:MULTISPECIES: transglycosylase family protein [unclassified Streptomyces]|uniref:transglycosylase family protein n=1 Tax=unclassified Streptomyces TaxID=2593676 RepID=UPI0033C2A576